MNYYKVIFEEPQPGEEDHIVVRCRAVGPELLQVLDKLKKESVTVLPAYLEDRLYRISPSDVFYIEAVDNKVFYYCQNEVYESKQKLYALEDLLLTEGFLRVSKSLIVNLSKIESLAPALASRLEATLTNNERVMISRKYVNDLKERLGL